MAYRCRITEHGSCAICHDYVPPAQLGHLHEFRPNKEGITTICAECVTSIFAAAHAVLNAIRAAGLHYTDNDQLRAVIRNNVIIGVQTGFDLPPISLN